VRAREGFIYRRKLKDKATGKVTVLPTYWIGFGFMGRDIRESSKSAVRSDAVKLLQRRIQEINEGRYSPDSDRVRFEHLERIAIEKATQDELRSLTRIEYAFKRLREHFANTPALWIPRRIPQYIAARRKAGAKNATIAYELGCLRRAYSIAASPEHRLMSYRPTFELPAVRNVRKNFIDEPALQKILKELPIHLAPLAEYCYLTGMRKREATTLTWGQVDWQEKTITLPPGTTKSGKGRTFPFGPFPRLLALLRARRAATSAWELEHPGEKVDRVFWRAVGGDARPVGDFHETWQRACERAGFEDVRLHDTRRSAVRDFRRAGISAHDAMELIGHESLDMLKRYNIATKDDLEKAIAKRGALDAAESVG
jgi:integrase